MKVNIEHFSCKSKYNLSPLLCNVLRDLVPFVQFKKREKHPWRSVTFSKVHHIYLYRTVPFKDNFNPMIPPLFQNFREPHQSFKSFNQKSNIT